MNNEMLNESKIASRRRLKFGGIAVAITVVIIALTVLINAIFSVLAQKYSLFIDMTDEKIFSITDTTRNLLNDLRGVEDFNIDIVFCTDADTLDGKYETRLVHNLAKEYAEEFDFVHVSYVDIINHPNELSKYMATSISTVNTTSTIITNGTESKVFKYASFYTVDSESGNIFAFNGEYKMTSAILQLAGDKPIAYFVKGHGENVTENADGTVSGEMTTLFYDAGFDVRAIDLTRDELDPSAKVMVIDGPKMDFLANDSVNEIEKIDAFLSAEGRCGGLMVFMDSSTKALPNLDEYLVEWGIKFEESQVRDYNHSYNVEGTEIRTTYTTEGTGASLTSAIRELNSYPDAVLTNCRPISFTFTDNQKLVGGSMRYTSAVLTTSADRSAVATSLNDSSVSENGVFNLMTVTVDSRYIDNEPNYSYVVGVGSSSMADEKYIGSTSYANRDIIFNLMKNLAKKTVPADIDFKVFEDTNLVIEKSDANKWTGIITVVPALVVAVAGIIVYWRRRYL